jgi:hypothetical protein
VVQVGRCDHRLRPTAPLNHTLYRLAPTAHYLQDTCKVGLLVGKPAANPGSYNQGERPARPRGASSPDAHDGVGASPQSVAPQDGGGCSGRRKPSGA